MDTNVERSYEIDAFQGEILRLLNHDINNIINEIISAMPDFNDLKRIFTDLNRMDPKNNHYNTFGETAEEVLKANSIDKKINYIQYYSLSKAENVLHSWAITMDLKKELELIRRIRNRLSHYSDYNRYKNIQEVTSDLFSLSCFLYPFSMKFSDHWDAFVNRYKTIMQKAVDFAHKYNEAFIPLKSNKISIEDYCLELQNDIFVNTDIKTIKDKLLRALADLRIDIIDGKFNKEFQDDIIKFFLKNNDEISSPPPEPRTGIRQVECLDFSKISNAHIRTFIRDFNILVDYRCIASESVRRIIQNRLVPVLKFSGNRLFYISESIKEYCDQHANALDKDETVSYINSNIENNVYSYIQTDQYAADDDERIMHVLSTLHKDRSFCVVTASQRLISGILDSGRDGVMVINAGFAITQDGRSSGSYKKRRSKAGDENVFPRQQPEPEEFKPMFKLQTQCIVDTNTVLKVSEIPGRGDYVYTSDNKAIELVDFISCGGEGSIYTTSDPGIVAKIYFEKCITQHRKDKLSLMTQYKPEISNVCWPMDIVTNKHGEFVGYTMAKACGSDMAKTIFKGRCMGFTRTQLVDCLINIFKTISLLHKNNILMGDINGGNILINSPQEIYFVDTDSYQIDQYPCPVGTELFTPPEIYKSQSGELRDFSRFLRSPEDERYALGVLAFMTLIPGATPYPMVEGKFLPGFRFPRNGKKAEGKLTYNCIWSYLPKNLKELFWMVFDDKCRSISADEWIQALNVYKRDIGSDDTKNQIFITTYKDPLGDAFVTDKLCPICNMPLNITQEEYNKRSAKGKEVWCRACMLKQNHKKNLTMFMFCKGCKRFLCVSKTHYDRQKKRLKQVVCDDCGCTVQISSYECDKRVRLGWRMLCSDCDSSRGLYNQEILCKECDPSNGIALRYNIPTITDIINSLE